MFVLKAAAAIKESTVALKLARLSEEANLFGQLCAYWRSKGRSCRIDIKTTLLIPKFSHLIIYL